MKEDTRRKVDILKLETKTLEDEYKFCKSDNEQKENILERKRKTKEALYLLETIKG